MADIACGCCCRVHTFGSRSAHVPRVDRSIDVQAAAGGCRCRGAQHVCGAAADLIGCEDRREEVHRAGGGHRMKSRTREVSVEEALRGGGRSGAGGRVRAQGRGWAWEVGRRGHEEEEKTNKRR